MYEIILGEADAHQTVLQMVNIKYYFLQNKFRGSREVRTEKLLQVTQDSDSVELQSRTIKSLLLKIWNEFCMPIIEPRKNSTNLTDKFH